MRVQIINNLRNIYYSNIPDTTINTSANTRNTINFLGYNSKTHKAYASPQINDTKQKAKAVWNEIEKSNNIVILTHKYADGDAISAGLALVNTLQEQFPNKNVKFIVPAGIPQKFKGVPGVNSIIINKENYLLDKTDLAIAVDCDETLIDGLEIYKNAGKRINIDHHTTNINLINKTNPRDLLLIDVNAPSTTDILYNKLFKPLNIEVSNRTAECILTGIITDTGNFKYVKNVQYAKNTRHELLNILNKTEKFSIGNVFSKMDNYKESKGLKRLGEYLLDKNSIKTFQTNYGKKIDYIVVNQYTLNYFKIKDSKPDIKEKVKFLVNKLRENAHISMIFWETGEPQDLKVEMRSNDLSIKELAFKYGGGGHDHAAGFSLIGETNKIIAKLISELKEYRF